jgi:hypothetical protein
MSEWEPRAQLEDAELERHVWGGDYVGWIPVSDDDEVDAGTRATADPRSRTDASAGGPPASTSQPAAPDH